MEGTALQAQVNAQAASGTGWTTKGYLLALAALLAMAAIPLAIGVAVDEPLVGAVLAAVPVAVLVLAKPEIGLFLFVLLVGFEALTVLPGGVTGARALGLFTAAALAVHLVGRRRIELSPYAFWFLAAFTAWSMLATIKAPDTGYAWRLELTRIQMAGLVFVVLNACWTREEVKTLVWVVFLASALAAATSFFLTPEPQFAGGIQRATVGGENVNAHAKNLIVAFFVFPFLFSRSSAWLRIVLVAAVGITLVGLGATGSRSAYIAVLAGILVTVLVYRRFGVATRLSVAVGVVALLGLAVAVGVLSGLWDPRLGERLTELVEQGLETGGRAWLWKQTFLLGASHPLLGAGLGGARLGTLAPGAFGVVAHNDILTHFAETGVPGLVFYLAFVIAVFKALWRWRHTALGAGLIGLFACGTLMSMANPSIGVKSYWLQAGLCMLVAARFRQGVMGEAAARAGSAGARNNVLRKGNALPLVQTGARPGR